MLRPLRILLASCLVLLPVANTAWAANMASEKPDDAAKKAALAEAMKACNQGASVPLDPDAKAPPVQYGELFPADFDLTKLRVLSDKCQAAMLGAPQEKRLKLQWLRIKVALDEPGLVWLVPQIKLLADGGSAEANFLLFEFFQIHHGDADAPPLISRDMALDSLRKSGDAGHLTALLTLLNQYSRGPLLRRDARKVVETAQRIIDAPVRARRPTNATPRSARACPG